MGIYGVTVKNEVAIDHPGAHRFRTSDFFRIYIDTTKISFDNSCGRSIVRASPI